MSLERKSSSKTSPEKPRGRYYVDPKAGVGRVASLEPEYVKATATFVSATEASRQFSDLINRAAYQGEKFVIERGGKPLCQLGPLEDKRCTGADLLEMFSRLPKADPEYLDAVDEIIRNQEPLEPSPWEK
jgi:antitoxin (DNA-binding transcriptional repressor) of toxin-antitoxin stability system